VEGIGAAATEFIPLLVPVFVAATRDEETEVSSNAAYVFFFRYVDHTSC
jgi:hypothetical protein